MNLARFVFTITAAIAVTACLDPEATPDTSADEQAACVAIQAAPGATVPNFVDWQGVLPGGDSSRQAWILMARTTNPNAEWALYRIDLVGKKVTWAARFKASQRGEVYATILPKNQAIGGIRVPPGPIGPGGQDWFQATALVRAGYFAYYLGQL